MNGPVIHWNGQPLAFAPGESVAHALTRAGVTHFGPGPVGLARAVFCGIGQCQMCLVLINGRTAEACLTLCVAGMQVAPENALAETEFRHD
jgi:D-hydroxyproline dehydrogenase subunit gamma